MSDSKIDTIKARLGQPLQPNRFLVQFLSLPQDFGFTADRDTLSILCSSATVPGKTITVEEHGHFGPKKQMATGEVDYGKTMSFEFMCDDSFLDRLIIKEWMKFVHSANISDTLSDIGGGENAVLRFYDEYAQNCQVRIQVLRKDDSVAKTITLHECFPTVMNEIALSSESTDEIMKFGFDLSYRYFTEEDAEGFGDLALRQPRESTFNLSSINRGRRGFDAILDSLSVASRFNSKAGDLLRKLSRLDTFITRAGTIGRDINPNYITEKRRGS